ncbi:MAG TPA: ABC transporter transmembrane domain-containing protein, partial [Gemmobacter sp.]|nr:ABC transporter transmembrane domain-containing protein [Gemmobacter sp.]
MADLRDSLARALARVIFGGAAGDWLPPVIARALPAMAMVLLASLGASALGLTLPLLTKQVIDAGIMARDMGALVTWSGLAFMLGLATVASGAANALLHLHASARMLADLRLVALHASLTRNPALPEMPLGEAMARVDGDCAEMQGFAFDTVLVAVGALFRLLGGFALMALLDWRLTLLPLAAAPLELWVLSRARPRTQALAETVREGRGAQSAQMAETLASAPGLAALGALPGREAGFAALQQSQIAALLAQRRWSEAVGAFSQILTATMRALVLLAGGWLVVQGHWPIGTLVAYLAYAGMMSGPLRNLLGLYHAQARMRVAAARLEAVMRESRADEGAALRPQGEITLQAACALGANHLPVSFTVRPGDVLLLDGPSGIGKSRLLAALTRRAPLAMGQVLIHGQPVETLRPSALAAQILHLTQRPVLIRGTLAQNLRLAAP